MCLVTGFINVLTTQIKAFDTSRCVSALILGCSRKTTSLLHSDGGLVYPSRPQSQGDQMGFVQNN